MMNLKLLLATGALFAVASQAQTNTTPEPDNWYVGLGGGLHSSFLRYSDLNEDIYPTKRLSNGGVFAIFAQGEFGDKHQYAIRPELTYTHRGGKLKDIGSGLYDEGSGMSYYALNGLKDIRYSLSAHYIDIRVPLIYQFGKKESALRPYVYVAPILGFCVGGKIKAEMQYAEGKDSYSYAGYAMDLSKKNMSSVYFAGAVGAGLKWQVKVGEHTCY